MKVRPAPDCNLGLPALFNMASLEPKEGLRERLSPSHPQARPCSCPAAFVAGLTGRVLTLLVDFPSGLPDGVRKRVSPMIGQGI